MKRWHSAASSRTSSWARPPVGQQRQKIGDADVPGAFEVGGAAAFARPPACQQKEKVGDAHNCVVIKVPRARRSAGRLKEVCRAGVDGVVVVKGCPNEGGAAADRDSEAELVARLAVVGPNYNDLAARVLVEEVGGAGVDTVVVVPDGPDGGSGVADRDPVAEEVEYTTRRTVNWSDCLGGVHWTAVFGAALMFAIMVVTIVRIGRR